MTIRIPLCALTLILAASAANLPLYFEPNRGQAPSGVDYLLRGNGADLRLNSREVTFPLAKGATHLRFLGARSVRGEALEALPGKSSYLTLDGHGRNLSGIPQFGRIRYAGVYPGVDLLYYANGGNLEYDFVVAPGTSPSQIRLSYDGVTARLDHGDLLLASASGEIRQRKPRAYQEIAGHRVDVATEYLIDTPNNVTFYLSYAPLRHAV